MEMTKGNTEERKKKAKITRVSVLTCVRFTESCRDRQTDIKQERRK